MKVLWTGLLVLVACAHHLLQWFPFVLPDGTLPMTTIVIDLWGLWIADILGIVGVVAVWRRRDWGRMVAGVSAGLRSGILSIPIIFLLIGEPLGYLIEDTDAESVVARADHFTLSGYLQHAVIAAGTFGFAIWVATSRHCLSPGLLASACRRGDVSEIEYLLVRGIPPDAVYGNGYTPLVHAIRAHRKDVVDILLKAGADPNQPCGPKFRKTTAITAAEETENTAVLACLIEKAE